MTRNGKMKTVVAGSRNFNDYMMLKRICDESNITEVVSGTANGADKMGEMWAVERRVPRKLFPAEWDTYGKRAGHLRNFEMAKYAEQAIVFWDGESKGSKNMIDNMKKLGKPVKVVMYNEKDLEEW